MRVASSRTVPARRLDRLTTQPEALAAAALGLRHLAGAVPCRPEALLRLHQLDPGELRHHTLRPSWIVLDRRQPDRRCRPAGVRARLAAPAAVPPATKPSPPVGSARIPPAELEPEVVAERRHAVGADADEVALDDRSAVSASESTPDRSLPEITLRFAAGAPADPHVGPLLDHDAEQIGRNEPVDGRKGKLLLAAETSSRRRAERLPARCPDGQGPGAGTQLHRRRSCRLQTRSELWTGTIGARRAWTVSMISVLSMPWR